MADPGVERVLSQGLCMQAERLLQTAENIMRVAQVRRVPVVDDDCQLWGMISLGDLAQHVHRGGGSPDGLSYASVALTLAAISQPALERPTDSEFTGPLERQPIASLEVTA
jgi:CBS domain-containing protein